ncbi:putative methyltransferase-domain-containing protein [Zychaea mexicana]|uniref:putative methyltransferase-domain-containing protein n=1 Tax=Zychaea mexicana TaxID=64656 RepID=UPI0022FE5DE6|nr:putative methyltransferase-domain-containing protein [Zychaea mexicana]KAI9490408.1 putative methyltransferase-domain-containing protein [Zychaea mexicana]
MAPAISDRSKDEYDFLVGNCPEGLNVVASEGPPSAWKNTLSHLSLKQDVEQFGLAGKIWHAAYILQSYFYPDTRVDPKSPIPAQYFRNDPSPVPTQPFRILELGAGTGYVGIWLANMLRQPCEMIITDLEPVLPLIRDNVTQHYQHIVDDNSATVRVERLHWGNTSDASAILKEGPIDLILISDCVYFPELFDILTQSLIEICSPTTKIVIGYKCRSLEKESGFWQDYFGRYFDYEPVRKLEFKQDEDDDDSGDDGEKKLIPGGLLGEEEQVFVFVGQRRADGQIKAADDTFTTLMFCNMMIDFD